jgi:hypothetical protein
MKGEWKAEFKIWGSYFFTIFIVTFLHETGHCIPAWINGYPAIPTPAKEYSLTAIPSGLLNYVSLGGLTATVLVAVFAMLFFFNSSYKYKEVILAGTLAMPSVYTFRFILIGRGHDATEFQEAQSALGLSYSGHFFDWLFLAIAILGATVWFIKKKPKSQIARRLLIGLVVSIVFIVLLQKINNLIFDPLFL